MPGLQEMDLETFVEKIKMKSAHLSFLAWLVVVIVALLVAVNFRQRRELTEARRMIAELRQSKPEKLVFQIVPVPDTTHSDSVRIVGPGLDYRLR